jgi:hypothetical protein
MVGENDLGSQDGGAIRHYPGAEEGENSEKYEDVWSVNFAGKTEDSETVFLGEQKAKIWGCVPG